MADAGQLKGYTLLDAQGNTVGPVTAWWGEPGSDRAAYVAVRAGLGRASDRVVPLRHARLDEDRRTLRVPYARPLILASPPYAASDAPDIPAVDLHYRQAPVGTDLGAQPALGELALHGERVDVGRRVVEAGGVRLRKVVRREIVHVPVEVLREEIVVERVAPGEDPLARDAPGISGRPFEEGALFLPEYREEPLVSKHTEVIGGVRASKRVDTVREVVRADARREDVEVEREDLRGGDLRRDARPGDGEP